MSNALFIVFALLAVAICFSNSLHNDFILDDYQIVAVNPAIRSVSPAHFLSRPYWGQSSHSGIYRPLTLFSFALEYPLWHRWPGGYRLVNLLLHAINGILVFVLARGLLQSNAAAWAAGALYVLHPVHTEPVIELTGRGELLAAMFFIAAWLLFRRKNHVLCGIAFLLSLLSKESAIMFPAVIALDVWIFEASFRKVVEGWKRFAPLAVAAAVVFIVGNTASLMGLSAVGRSTSTTVLGGAYELWQQGYQLTAAFVASLAPSVSAASTSRARCDRQRLVKPAIAFCS